MLLHRHYRDFSPLVFLVSYMTEIFGELSGRQGGREVLTLSWYWFCIIIQIMQDLCQISLVVQVPVHVLISLAVATVQHRI